MSAGARERDLCRHERGEQVSVSGKPNISA